MGKQKGDDLHKRTVGVRIAEKIKTVNIEAFEDGVLTLIEMNLEEAREIKADLDSIFSLEWSKTGTVASEKGK